jgi:pyruvate/2-oxoglutarate dehydrogenase complex dihydrolipoamide dehydrogenase (E3) component
MAKGDDLASLTRLGDLGYRSRMDPLLFPLFAKGEGPTIQRRRILKNRKDTIEAPQIPELIGRLNPEPDQRYNLVVIGAGPAGLVAALGAAQLGARTAVIEKHNPGGTSLHTGSVPSKALIRAARVASELKRAPEFGLHPTGGMEVDFPAVMERIGKVRDQIAKRESLENLLAAGIDVYVGEGHFTSRSQIEVNGRELNFSRAVIAAGARPVIPMIEGIERIDYLTSETVFALDTLPATLAVIGAGPLGCELAQVFASFGSRVIIYEKSERILTREDEDAALMVQQSLEADGVVFRLGCTRLKFEKKEWETVVHAGNGHVSSAERCDRVLIAAGRAPRIEGLNLEAAGVRYDEKGVLVNHFLRTSSHRIFAAGDICTDYPYTHAADALAHIVMANALFFGTESASHLNVPWCTHTDPEIAHVGVHQAEAEERHLSTISVPFEQVDRAILDGDTRGLLKIHHDHKGAIKGATLVAPHAGDMISEIVVAMNHNVRLGALASDIHPYPTLSEAIRIAADHYRHALVTPAIAGLMKRIMAWRR